MYGRSYAAEQLSNIIIIDRRTSYFTENSHGACGGSVVVWHSQTGMAGNSGPYMWRSRRAVRHSDARVHCSVSGARCRQRRHCSRSVRHSGGGGKHLSNETVG